MVTSQKLLYFYTEINVNAYVLYRGYIVKARNVIQNEARFAFYSIQKNCKIKSDADKKRTVESNISQYFLFICHFLFYTRFRCSCHLLLKTSPQYHWWNTQSLISSVNIEKSGIPFNMNMVIILQTYIVNAYVFVIPT